MEVEKMVDLLLARLAALGVTDIDEPEADIERERAYVVAFCGLPEIGSAMDDELCAICVELAAAAILERVAALDDKGSVKNISMGDVSVGYGESEADSGKRLAEGIYRRAIVRLAARRGIKW